MTTQSPRATIEQIGKSKMRYVQSRLHSQSDQATSSFILGMIQLSEQYVRRGYVPYMITFMFPFGQDGSPAQLLVINYEVARVYTRFLTEVVRRSKSDHGRSIRPILIGCSDWYVYKRRVKARNSTGHPTGVHAAGILLVPPRNRLRTGVKDHFESAKRLATSGTTSRSFEFI